MLSLRSKATRISTHLKDHIMTPHKVIRNGNVAILISSGFGAGWSTWAEADLQEMLLFDKKFVEAAEAGVKDIEPVIKEIFGNDVYVYDGGWKTIKVKWLPIGTAFFVDEYDGSERLRIASDLTFKA